MHFNIVVQVNMHIPNNVNYLGMFVFDSCLKLKKVTLPTNINSIN